MAKKNICTMKGQNLVKKDQNLDVSGVKSLDTTTTISDENKWRERKPWE